MLNDAHSMIDSQNLCRLCLTGGAEFVDIFSSSSSDLSPSLDERINRCLPVKVTRTDSFPTKLCLPCADTVNKIYPFWLQAESSQKRLQQQLLFNGSRVHPDQNEAAGPSLTPGPDCEREEPTPSVPCLSSPLKNPVTSNSSARPKKASEEKAVAICISCGVHRNDSSLQFKGSAHPCFICNQAGGPKVPRDSRKYECSVCDYTNTSLSNFKIHMMKHNGQHVAYCRHCGKGFYSRSACEDHERVKHDGDPVSCQMCDKTFHSKAYLRLHVKRHRPDFINDGHQCDKCGKTFKSAKGANRHKMADHGGRLYRCDVCDKEVKSLDSLKNHLKIHRGEKTHACSLCGKAFRTKSGLTVHERTHSGVKPFKCQICGNSFSQSSSLKIHVRFHNGDRPFQCGDCSKGFVTLTRLKMHQAKHYQ